LALQTLAQATPNLINLGLVTLVFFILFSIFSVAFLKGRFYYCDLSNVPECLHSQLTTQWDCLNGGGLWRNNDINFDNSLKGIEAIFVIGIVAWIKTMWAAVDSTGVNMMPTRDNNVFWVVFFIWLVIIFAFFLINLFVGVVVSTFN